MLVNRKSFTETGRNGGFVNGTVEVTLRGETRAVRAHYYGERLNKATLVVSGLVDHVGNDAAIQSTPRGSEAFLKDGYSRVRGVSDVEAKVFFAKEGAK